MYPDPKKVQGIIEMTPPSEKQQLQSFLGMVNYMGGFIPNLSHHTEPLRAMLKKTMCFVNQSFQEIKALILKANETPLRYNGRTLPVTVQADASLRISHTAIQWEEPANCLCQQDPHRCRDMVCQHRGNFSQLSLPASALAHIYWEVVSQQRVTTSHWR